MTLTQHSRGDVQHLMTHPEPQRERDEHTFSNVASVFRRRFFLSE